MGTFHRGGGPGVVEGHSSFRSAKCCDQRQRKQGGCEVASPCEKFSGSYIPLTGVHQVRLCLWGVIQILWHVRVEVLVRVLRSDLHGRKGAIILPGVRKRDFCCFHFPRTSDPEGAPENATREPRARVVPLRERPRPSRSAHHCAEPSAGHHSSRPSSRPL